MTPQIAPRKKSPSRPCPGPGLWGGSNEEGGREEEEEEEEEVGVSGREEVRRGRGR